MLKLLTVAVAIAAGTLSVPAAAVVIVGDTTGAPTFNRPVSGIPPTTLSGVGTAVRYVVTPFTVAVSGAYDFLNTTGYDSYLGIHAGSFDPGNALLNAVAYEDDFVDLDAGFDDLGLLAGTQYFAVSAGFDNSDFGAFSLEITGPGTVTVGAGIVPEPASWAMLIAGFGLVGASMRRRRLTTVAA